MARDRVGKKPLYWGHVGKDIVFASELKAVCKFPGFHKTLSDASIASFFKYGYINSPKTIYENIFKLEPGTFLYVDEDKQPKINRYWSLDKVIAEYKLENIGFAEQQHGLELLLKDAINKRMISDVPVGVMLSGGIDSSLVTAIMQTGNSQKVKSYSIGFNEKQYDESVYAKKISEHLGTEHHEFHVEPGTAIDLLPGLPDIYDEPFADASQIPTFIVSQLLKKEVTVALSGDGGDEVFAGYSRYFWGDKFSKYNKALPYNIRLLISKLIHSVSPETLDNIFTIAPKKLRPSHSGERLHKIANILSVNSDSDIYSKLVCQWDPNTLLKNHVREENIDLSDFPGKYDIISAMQYSDFNSYLPGDILVKVDRASMANSLEIRSPLLDHRIIEYAWKLDMDSKIYNGKGKHILREILYKYVPKNLVDRPKMGFGVPISAWLRGPLKEWAFDLLSEDRIKKQGLFHSEPVLEMLNVHMSKKRNYQYPLWTMLMFQSWYDRWITDV
ncbi:MAG: asparagine synthetase B [marine bacterium B5-7]|nr:MAG: asparagine synthetase B [marine bacterium B5-7]